jgi:hypothetical protein
MASDWWGDWRPTLPTHTGNLQPTDLIECTSIVGGLPVNTAITGQQIINAASGTTAWGAITGTLSSQTDLQNALNAKQDALVSGTNIKTVNSTSLLGSGNIAVQDTLVSGTNIKTVNSTSLLGSGNITIAASPYTLVGSAVGSTITNTTSNMSSASILVPANTMVSNQILQIRTKYWKSAGTTASTARIYVNTNNSLAGATLIATCTSQTTAGIINFQRDHLLISNALYCWSPTLAAITDIGAAAALNTATFNPAVNNYIIFAIQNTSISDIAQFMKVNVMIY